MICQQREKTPSPLRNIRRRRYFEAVDDRGYQAEDRRVQERATEHQRRGNANGGFQYYRSQQQWPTMERSNDYQRRRKTWTLVNSMGQPDNQPPASPVRQQPHVTDCYNRNASNYMGRRGGAAAAVRRYTPPQGEPHRVRGRPVYKRTGSPVRERPHATNGYSKRPGRPATKVRRVIAPRGGPRRSSGQPDNKHCKADKTQRPDETARLAYTGSSEMRARLRCREDTADQTIAAGGDRQSRTHCSLDKTESRLRSKIIVVPNSVPNAFDHPLSVSPKNSQVGMSYQQCLRAKPQPAPNTTNQSVPSISMSKTSRLGEDLLNADTAQLASAEHKTQSLAEDASSAEPDPEAVGVPIGTHREEGAVHIVSQTESLHTVETDCARRDCAPESMADPEAVGVPIGTDREEGAVHIVSQNTLEDMLRDVEYVNAFQEHTTCDFYSSDLDVDKQIWNVESYQDHFVDPVSQAVSSILPSPSDNSDRVLRSTERTIQGNADFENVCDYIFQQNQSVQPLEGQPHPPEMPEVPRHTQPHEDQVDSQGPVNTLFELVQKLISCSVCNNTFNRTFVCEDYLIQLNRPIQCACCCVLCSLCYREQKGCRTHKIVSARAVVNAAASILASCPDMEKVGEWDLELDDMDHFKTEADINRHVQQLMTGERTPGIEALRSAFNSLMTANDSMSFKHWLNEALPEELAYRYVCIPHIKWFWNHIAAGKWIPGSTEVMIGHDEHLLKLFKVSLGSYRFHWCCFVLKKQIILAMWCTSAPKRGQPKVITLVDSALKPYTESVDFKTMVLYLCRWFTVQYVSPQNRQLKVVLDCKPSEGSSLVHVVASLASKIGMPEVAPGLSQIRPKDDLNYGFNLSRAKDMLTCSSEDIVQGKYINLVEEFNYYHNQGTNTIGLKHMYTNTEQYNSL